MYLSKRLIEWLCRDPDSQITNGRRQYKLIKTTTFELICLSLILLCIHFSWHLWLMFYMISIACSLAALNLLVLKKTHNTDLCGHIITILTFSAISLANYWMGGLTSSFFAWYYVIPVLAAATIGWFGLAFYALICLLTIVVFATIDFTPVYVLTPPYDLVMSVLNYFFTLFVTASTLYSILRENAHYERMLQEHNYLLQADKDKFHYLARYDTLTNLPNRAYFQTYIQAIIETAKIRQHCATVFFMDLDGLKEINDHYGHEAGDSLILQAGKRLQACFREKDFLARLGGDEFTAIINHLKEDKVPKVIAERIVQEFNESFLIMGQELYCKISIGLASYPLATLNADELIAKADVAMYSAKKAGGNTYRVSEEIKPSQNSHKHASLSIGKN